MIFTASAGVGHGQIINWVGTFNSSADTARWTWVQGNPNTTISFLAGDAPPGQTNSTGCMVLESSFGPGTTNDWAVIQKYVQDLNVSNCSALEMDVKVDPSQTVYDEYGNACNNLEVGIEYGSAYTWVDTYGVGIAPVAANNGWQHIVVPANQLGGSTNWGDLKEVILDPWDGFFATATNMILRLDNIKFTAPAPVPPNPTISINASNAVRTADAGWFGINTTPWCPDFNIQDGVPEVNKAGWQALRYNSGDLYHWYENNLSDNNTFTNFAQVATSLGAAKVFVTANYGTGTPAEAAGWVAFSNVTNHYGIKYWEIGNEEPYNNTNSPYTYATNVAAYMQQMKAVDPTIKIGVCAVTGEATDANGNTNHPATNLVTGQVFYGWTPVVMSTLRQLGVTPDFAIEHHYPEDYPYAPDNDQTLLAATTTGSSNWMGDALELRSEITDFFGPGGTNIELDVTENNSDADTPGKQSVSLVNALYYCDSLGQLMQTEFNARLWWDLTDAGPGTSGDLSTNLYGWRLYGDFGTMMPGTAEPLTNRYPQYFAAELISHFIVTNFFGIVKIAELAS